jgi:hypothetical protein
MNFENVYKEVEVDDYSILKEALSLSKDGYPLRSAILKEKAQRIKELAVLAKAPKLKETLTEASLDLNTITYIPLQERKKEYNKVFETLNTLNKNQNLSLLTETQIRESTINQLLQEARNSYNMFEFPISQFYREIGPSVTDDAWPALREAIIDMEEMEEIIFNDGFHLIESSDRTFVLEEYTNLVTLNTREQLREFKVSDSPKDNDTIEAKDLSPKKDVKAKTRASDLSDEDKALLAKYKDVPGVSAKSKKSYASRLAKAKKLDAERNAGGPAPGATELTTTSDTSTVTIDQAAQQVGLPTTAQADQQITKVEQELQTEAPEIVAALQQAEADAEIKDAEEEKKPAKQKLIDLKADKEKMAQLKVEIDQIIADGKAKGEEQKGIFAKIGNKLKTAGKVVTKAALGALSTSVGKAVMSGVGLALTMATFTGIMGLPLGPIVGIICFPIIKTMGKLGAKLGGEAIAPYVIEQLKIQISKTKPGTFLNKLWTGLLGKNGDGKFIKIACTIIGAVALGGGTAGGLTSLAASVTPALNAAMAAADIAVTQMPTGIVNQLKSVADAAQTGNFGGDYSQVGAVDWSATGEQVINKLTGKPMGISDGAGGIIRKGVETAHQNLSAANGGVDVGTVAASSIPGADQPPVPEAVQAPLTPQAQDTIENSLSAQAAAQPGDIVNGQVLQQGDINWAADKLAAGAPPTDPVSMANIQTVPPPVPPSPTNLVDQDIPMNSLGQTNIGGAVPGEVNPLDTVSDAPIPINQVDPSDAAAVNLPVAEGGVPDPLVPPDQQVNVITQDLADQGIQAPDEAIKASVESTNAELANGNLTPDQIADTAKNEAISAGADPQVADAIATDSMEASGFTKMVDEDGTTIWGRVNQNGGVKTSEVIHDTNGNGIADAGDRVAVRTEIGNPNNGFYNQDTRSGVLTKDYLPKPQAATPPESAASLAGADGNGIVTQPVAPGNTPTVASTTPNGAGTVNQTVSQAAPVQTPGGTIDNPNVTQINQPGVQGQTISGTDSNGGVLNQTVTTTNPQQVAANLKTQFPGHDIRPELSPRGGLSGNYVDNTTGDILNKSGEIIQQGTRIDSNVIANSTPQVAPASNGGFFKNMFNKKS